MRNYRGKTKDGKWVKGWYAKRFMPGDDEVPSDVIYEAEGLFPIEVIPETVCQSTGLFDKERSRFFPNGKEIYLKDLVKWNGFLWVVVWSKTLAGIQLQPADNYYACQKDKTVKRLYGPSFGIGQAAYSEKVGNVHDNPKAGRKESGTD